MVRLIRLLLALAALVIIVTFAIDNNQPIDVNLLPLPILVELPVYGVFLLGLVVGALIGGLIVWSGSIRQGNQARKMRNKVWALENQLSILRDQEERAQAQAYASRSRSLTVSGAS